jgi:pimeloyl-ACP methyl ester carboxylesterase
MQKVYFISGLGADERAFSQLDLSFCQPVYLSWIVPEIEETIADYAERIAKGITDEYPIIVGLSFGGMVAIEIAKLRPVKKLILISSAKTWHEFPRWLIALRYVQLHKLVKANLLKHLNSFAYRLMGVDDRADKILFKRMFVESDDRIVDWSVNTIIHWTNEKYADNLTHIHGTEDILLPFSRVKADIAVEGGEHLMPLIQPELVSDLLRSQVMQAGEVVPDKP